MATVSLLTSSSSSPETVTVCAVFQLPLVKVRLEGLSVAAPVSLLDGVTVTVPLGSVVSTTV